jgi:hypothetical protein
MKNLSILSGLILFIFTGCVGRTVPANSYKTPIGTFTFPKDMKARGITIQSTNFVLRIDEIESRNNPDVIQSSASGQALILREGINATGAAVGQAMAAYQKSMLGGVPTPAQQGPPAPAAKTNE